MEHNKNNDKKTIKTAKKNQITLPTLVMSGLVIFPNMTVHFDVGLEESLEAIQHAIEADKHIFLVAQKNPFEDENIRENIYQTGVISKVVQLIRTSENTARVLVEGIAKAKIVEFIDQLDEPDGKPYYECIVAEISTKKNTKIEKEQGEALLRSAKMVFQQYGVASPNFPKELTRKILAEEDLKKFFDYTIQSIMLKPEDRQTILEENDLVKQMELLVHFLDSEAKILLIQRDLFEHTRSQVDKNQRDYFLREQMKIISSQLGEADSQDEALELMQQLDEIVNMEDEIREKLGKECEKLYKMPPQSHEVNMQRTYLETVLELPWDEYTEDIIDVVKARKVLERDHFGMEKVKERILETIAVKKLAPDVKGQILCLVGPPGVGKTSIAKSIAKAVGRSYVRVSLGGVRDESDIRGHRKTYIGAMPGRIMTAIKQAKTRNPLILLDELDKMGSDFRGDPSSAMLEVLDGEQNVAFRDHYIEVPFDLSEVLFVTTANDISTIPSPLLDRMELIPLTSYTREEKFQIAKRHLIPKQLKKHGLTAKTFKLTDAGIYALLDYYTREAGVRKLERTVATLCRKAASRIVTEELAKVTINPTIVGEMLGPKKYRPEGIDKTPEVGLVNGLAWTSVGGELLPIEVAVLDGTGKIELTGSLGDVMKESARTAITYVRSIAPQYDIEPDFYKTKDIHIHAPEGAVPKDGPSAGLAMTTAIVSALTGKPIRNDLAMTGEVTLRGRALAIGGLKEKTMAAYRAGVHTVLIPKDNEPDLYEVDPVVKKAIEFVMVENALQVLERAFI